VEISGVSSSGIQRAPRDNPRQDRLDMEIARRPAYLDVKGAAMLDDVYNRRILELAGNIPRLGRLDHPDASATVHSKLCGSTVTVDLAMEGDRITDFAHEVKACALGQASSSIMARNIIGSSAAELRELRESVRRMLKENGAPPSGKWEDIRVLEPVRDYKARHASTLLTFDAVVDAIGQIEAKRRVAGGAPGRVAAE
jgi:NifU-like protein involved in Fe-S cluster formation